MESSFGISYKGKVTLKVMHGGKAVQTIEQRNEGSLLLMRFLANCLGSNYDAAKAPRYIMAYHLEGQGMEGVTSSARVSLRPVATNFKPTYKEESRPISAKVALSFLIPSSLIDNQKTITRIALYDGDDQRDSNYMAWISVDPIQVSAGESLLVLWEMTLQNSEASSGD